MSNSVVRIKGKKYEIKTIYHKEKIFTFNINGIPSYLGTLVIERDNIEIIEVKNLDEEKQLLKRLLYLKNFDMILISNFKERGNEIYTSFITDDTTNKELFNIMYILEHSNRNFNEEEKI